MGSLKRSKKSYSDLEKFEFYNKRKNDYSLTDSQQNHAVFKTITIGSKILKEKQVKVYDDKYMTIRNGVKRAKTKASIFNQLDREI